MELDDYLDGLNERVLSKAMTQEEKANYTESVFESIKHVNEYGQEFWYAVPDHFVDVNKIVEAGATHKDIRDIELSRYACYLIVQNGDSRKKVIALGQSYFAIRHEMIEHNKQLVAAAKGAGIETTLDYAISQNHGYIGLYGE